VRLGGHVGQRPLPTTLQDLHPLAHVAEQQRRLELPVDVLAHLGDLHHLPQLVQVARDQVEERELVKVLGALVAHLDDLVVALHQRHLGQLLPAEFVVEGARRLQRYLDVAALERKAEPRLLVLDEVERHLRVALLLQVRDYALADEDSVSDHVQHLVVFPLDQGQLELVLSRVDVHDARSNLGIQV